MIWAIRGIILFRAPIMGLYAVGVAALALLFIGIHNAWDAAVYIAARFGQD